MDVVRKLHPKEIMGRESPKEAIPNDINILQLKHKQKFMKALLKLNSNLKFHFKPMVCLFGDNHLQV